MDRAYVFRERTVRLSLRRQTQSHARYQLKRPSLFGVIWRLTGKRRNPIDAKDTLDSHNIGDSDFFVLLMITRTLKIL